MCFSFGLDTLFTVTVLYIVFITVIVVFIARFLEWYSITAFGAIGRNFISGFKIHSISLNRTEIDKVRLKKYKYMLVMLVFKYLLLISLHFWNSRIPKNNINIMIFHQIKIFCFIKIANLRLCLIMFVYYFSSISFFRKY